MTTTADLGDVCKLLAEVRDLLKAAPSADPLAVGAEDLADLLGTSERNVWKLSGEGLIPEPFKLGGRVLWNVAEVRRWLDAGSPDREAWARMKKAKRTHPTPARRNAAGRSPRPARLRIGPRAAATPGRHCENAP